MATRFRKLRTRRVKRRHALKTRRHKGGQGPLTTLKAMFSAKKSPVSGSPPAASQNAVVSGKNPMAKPLNERRVNVTLNKIQAEMKQWKEQQEGNRKPSTTSDPGNP